MSPSPVTARGRHTGLYSLFLQISLHSDCGLLLTSLNKEGLCAHEAFVRCHIYNIPKQNESDTQIVTLMLKISLKYLKEFSVDGIFVLSVQLTTSTHDYSPLKLIIAVNGIILYVSIQSP